MNLGRIDKYLLNEGDLKQERAMHKRMVNAVQKAQDAFWKVIESEYKEAKTNNVDSYAVQEFNGACERMVKNWCMMNMPRAEMRIPESDKPQQAVGSSY